MRNLRAALWPLVTVTVAAALVLLALGLLAHDAGPRCRPMAGMVMAGCGR